jgi:hypothetical protein
MIDELIVVAKNLFWSAARLPQGRCKQKLLARPRRLPRPNGAMFKLKLSLPDRAGRMKDAHG